MKKQRKFSPDELCPNCLEPFEDCVCENLFNKDDLIERDDEHIEDAFNIY